MKIKNSALLLLGLIALAACQTNEDDFVPYGPEYNILGIKAQGEGIRPDNWYYSDYSSSNNSHGVDTFKNDGLMVKVVMKYDNPYVKEYGININTTDKVSGIKVFNTESNIDVSQYFLVANNTGDHLYRTIGDFFKTPVTANSDIDLVFTNRKNLTPLADTLVQDTTNLQLRVELTLETSKMYESDINVVLVPQLNQ